MNRLRKVISASLCIMIVCTSITTDRGSARSTLKEKYSYGSNDNRDEYAGTSDEPRYAEIVKKYEKNNVKPASGAAIIQGADKTKIAGGSERIVERDIGGNSSEAFIWREGTDWAEWDFEVTAEGLYNIEVAYYLLPGTGKPAARSLLVDGKAPFAEAADIEFPRKWEDKGEPVINSLGDETRPSQIEISAWASMKLIDGSGLYAEPFRLHLEPGRHTVRLAFVDQAMAIAQVALVPSAVVPSYEEVKQQYRQQRYSEATASVQFEAESHTVDKSDPTIRRESSSDPAVSPNSLTHRKLNVLGGYAWRKGNQSVTWEFQVPEDGLYKIGIRVLQSWNDGLPSFRQIALDGEVPFAELLEYRFDYKKGWRLETLQDDNDVPYLFYLTAGIHHLTMTVKLGPIAPIMQSLNDDTLRLSKIIRDIVQVAGSNPDPHYDYAFFETIPGMKADIETLVQSLQLKYDQIKGMSHKLPAMASNFLTIKSQLTAMLNHPSGIANRINDLNNAQTSLGTWYLSLQEQPLMVDYFKTGPADDKWVNVRAGFFQKLRFTFVNFLLSFKKDYDRVGSTMQEHADVKSTIDVWIAGGTEWAEIIKEMADSEFTPKTGIAINVNVLPVNQLEAGNINALMLSITSGNAPDVGLGVPAASPVEFAIRDAVYDLSQFADFDEVSRWFLPNIMIPYRYRGGVYALPETMDFSVMFYRKDLLRDLGIRIPDTREELYSYVLPTLYQNGMQFYFPQDFTSFIFQHGGNYYTADGKKSALDTPEAYRAFQEYTELFTNYGVPVSANFYNRMRTGEMPLGIGNFGT
ncbi:MAG: extracellular solute-binding protein, partial [Cohnella sp.]|nr:extracellular solute-binding protein [Cohnella sp.]